MYRIGQMRVIDVLRICFRKELLIHDYFFLTQEQIKPPCCLFLVYLNFFQILCCPFVD
ncbi:Uncharacterised protein [Segatella copri]|nr:Uncharacterised protein [Segatella copri]